ncbi:hypothetical protein PO909_008728 [Leuciscus waleckii]
MIQEHYRSEVRLDQNIHNIIQFEDRSHAGMETSLLRISADGCCVDEDFTGESLVDTISADTSGMCCGRV